LSDKIPRLEYSQFLRVVGDPPGDFLEAGPTAAYDEPLTLTLWGTVPDGSSIAVAGGLGGWGE